MNVRESKEYLRTMEKYRHKREKENKRTYADARELSAMVCLAEYGHTAIVKKAENVIKNI